jgi:hypothetical protein
MLKLTYTASGFALERLTQSLEEWVNTRVLLALRCAAALYMEPSTAAFLLPADLPYLADLQKLAQQNPDILDICPCDGQSVEVSLQGTWLTSAPDDEGGVFVCLMGEHAEFFLEKLWQDSHLGASVEPGHA